MNASQVGEAAGELWKRLAGKGPLPLKLDAKSTGADRALVFLAAGWLAREGKVQFQEKGGEILVALTEEEFKKARP